jgi:hypothetical protein
MGDEEVINGKCKECGAICTSIICAVKVGKISLQCHSD